MEQSDSAELGGTKLVAWGNRLAGAGGTGRLRSITAVFKKLSRNLLGFIETLLENKMLKLLVFSNLSFQIGLECIEEAAGAGDNPFEMNNPSKAP